MADSVSKFVAEAKKQSKERKFLESLELAINLKDVDLSDPKNRINDELVLPNGRGKETKIAVIGSEELKAKARGVRRPHIRPRRPLQVRGEQEGVQEGSKRG